ncbi:hypothetical protein [Segniliparus rugosus]|uniref:Transmembrane protein n=1 Tax=Segniliparus rugosus (strain ATCC BAA-974 / DSM 45345 / CCUG 50838 / CIP 108380 / JCM 13579 / CDC 945) TaxID=679197 RepID=E5XPE4_SEGRC|nr:hypothetical protein [Segniliparus rugosus]EFV13772.1 hypothetical protein HMPREF9336_01372 [Segniliparus rugosus ATCC BAA-974]
MEEQDQPSVSVKDLLARMGKEESDVVLGGRSRRRRPGANSVSVGDLTGEIPVVRDGSPRTHRAEQQNNRKWSGWSKREDPDAHLDQRDREWDFRVLSGEIERVQDRDEDADEQAQELEGGPSVYTEQPPFQDSYEQDAAGQAPWGALERGEEDGAFGAGEEPSQQAEAEAANGPEPVHAGWGETQHLTEAAAEEHESAEARAWSAEPGEGEASAVGETAWREEAASGQAERAEPEPAGPGHEEQGAKPHKRVSAFKADQLERAREVFEKRKSQGEAIHRTGFLGAVDKLAAVQLPAWASITLQFVVGFLVGAVLFWVFRQLWNGDGLAVVASSLAVVTIVVLVLGARWVRRKNDWASMAVAGLVGVWVCFGPLAISLFTK